MMITGLIHAIFGIVLVILAIWGLVDGTKGSVSRKRFNTERILMGLAGIGLFVRSCYLFLR